MLERLGAYRERLTTLLRAETWFEKRGLNSIKRQPTDDPTLARRRRLQAVLGAGFIILLLATVLWKPSLAAVGVLGCASAAVGLGTVRGRYYCDYLCPRGGFLDSYVRLLSRGKRTPGWFKHPLVRFGVAAVSFGALGVGLLLTWQRGGPLALPFLSMLGVSSLVAVGLGLWYHQRAWCQVCPAGTLAHAANRVSDRTGHDRSPAVTVDADAYLSCGRCGTVC